MSRTFGKNFAALSLSIVTTISSASAGENTETSEVNCGVVIDAWAEADTKVMQRESRTNIALNQYNSLVSQYYGLRESLLTENRSEHAAVLEALAELQPKLEDANKNADEHLAALDVEKTAGEAALSALLNSHCIDGLQNTDMDGGVGGSLYNGIEALDPDQYADNPSDEPFPTEPETLEPGSSDVDSIVTTEDIADAWS